jgi:ankyrin repeat protein
VQPPEEDGPGRDPIRALNLAIDDGDGERFARLLPTVPDLNAYDASGWRPLKRAIHVGSEAFTEQLLKAGADPNAKPLVDEASALVGAVRINRADLVELLLRYGAAPAAMDGESPLHDACAMKSVEMVALLLQAGATVDGDGGGDTPLMSAARAMSPEVARLLLERKPDVNRVDRDGRTALWWAASESPYGCATVNVIRVDPSEKLSPAELATRFELPPQLVRARRRHEVKIVEFVRLLLDHGADPNIADRAGKPPLAVAKCASVAKLLIERGARVDVRDRSKLGVYDWFALSGIAPDAVGLPPRAQSEQAARTAPARKLKRVSKERPGK